MFTSRLIGLKVVEQVRVMIPELDIQSKFLVHRWNRGSVNAITEELRTFEMTAKKVQVRIGSDLSNIQNHLKYR